MLTEVTKGIKVSVETKYKEEYSNSYTSNYVFSYKITIENLNEFSVQLLRRYWLITESNGEYREVEGEGVIGQQPILEPGDVYQYQSGCNLHTDIGSMKGLYTFKNHTSESILKVAIPKFDMIVPYRLN